MTSASHMLYIVKHATITNKWDYGWGHVCQKKKMERTCVSISGKSIIKVDKITNDIFTSEII